MGAEGAASEMGASDSEITAGQNTGEESSRSSSNQASGEPTSPETVIQAADETDPHLLLSLPP